MFSEWLRDNYRNPIEIFLAVKSNTRDHQTSIIFYLFSFPWDLVQFLKYILSLIARYSLLGFFFRRKSWKLHYTLLHFCHPCASRVSLWTSTSVFINAGFIARCSNEKLGESNKGSQINLLLHRRLDFMCVILSVSPIWAQKKSAKVNLFYHRSGSNLRSPVIHRRIKVKKNHKLIR